MSARLPITIVTAIVSPSARPKPRITAPKIPARELLRTAIFIISHWVQPRPSAASRCEWGMARKTSREIEEIVGMIMIARITPAVSIPTP